jgi:hypothetical protein
MRWLPGIAFLLISTACVAADIPPPVDMGGTPPIYGEPMYRGPAYGPAYGGPVYGGPVYGVPIYDEPMYGEPSDPMYRGPMYRGPSMVECRPTSRMARLVRST